MKKKAVLLSLINYQCLKQAKKWRGEGEGQGRGEGVGFQYTTKEQNYCTLKWLKIAMNITLECLVAIFNSLARSQPLTEIEDDLQHEVFLKHFFV